MLLSKGDSIIISANVRGQKNDKIYLINYIPALTNFRSITTLE